MNETALVADIQGCSVHDGPGIRTTVFFKGCPLNCVWCHNPECISFQKQELYYPEKCIGCGQCEQGCYAGARVVCGKEMTAAEIFERIAADRPYYGQTGGVTFSGGEPLSYPAVLEELITLCHENGIGTAIETCLYDFQETVLKSLDLVMADLKVWDEETHKKVTGVSNRRIKENFERLDQLGVPFIVRTPLIPGFSDSVDNICQIRDFVKRFQNIQSYELLDYHPLGNIKRQALGQKPVVFDRPAATAKEMKPYADLSR